MALSVLFLGKFSNNLVPNFLNVYQTLSHQKEVKLLNFKISIPKKWFVANLDKNNIGMLVANVPNLFATKYQPCFIYIKNIKIINEINYKKIIDTSQSVNGLFCKDNTQKTARCLSYEKDGRVLYFDGKQCDLDSFYSLINNIDVK